MVDDSHAAVGALPAAPVPSLSLLRLVSASLPIGSFAWSEGLESATSAGHVRDEADTLAWLRGRMEHSLSRLDLPILLRMTAAWQRGDAAAARGWSEWLLAARESAELRAQDRATGAALARLLCDLGVTAAAPWRNDSAASYAALFSLAAAEWEIDAHAAAEGFLFAWCESQVGAAIKLVPLGQTAGQRVLGVLLSAIPTCAELAQGLHDDELGAAEPGLAILSAQHETQYTRLFRS